MTRLRAIALLRTPTFAMVCVFLIDVVPKVLLILFVGTEMSPDAKQYLDSAATLWTDATYGLTPGEPWAGRPILYPLILSPFVGLFGPLPLPALYLQAAMSGLAACIAYCLGRRLGGSLAGVCSGLFYATYVPLMLFPRLFLSETIVVFLALWCLLAVDYMLCAEEARTKAVWAIAVGVSYALLALSREVAFPLLVLSLVIFAIYRRASPRASFRIASLAAIAFAATYCPWVVRNCITLERPILLSSRESVLQDVADGKASTFDIATATAELTREGRSFREARAEFKRMAARGERIQSPEVLSLRYARDCGQRFCILLGAHPCLRLPFPFTGQWVNGAAPRILRWFSFPHTLAMWLCVLVGAVITAIRRDLRLLHTLAIPFVLMCIYSLVHAIPRYQVPSYAALCVPAGVGLSLMLRRLYRLQPFTRGWDQNTG